MAQSTKSNARSKSHAAAPAGRRKRERNDIAQKEAQVHRIRQKRAEKGGVLYKISNGFRTIATYSSHAMGSPWAFVIAAASVVVWAALGKHYQYSETWQLVINTGTTIVTFLMIFLVQNTQNRDSRAIHLKLDELLRGVKEARTGMVDLEDATDEELDELQKQFETMRDKKQETPTEQERK